MKCKCYPRTISSNCIAVSVRTPWCFNDLFDNVVGVEINHKLVEMLRENVALNSVKCKTSGASVSLSDKVVCQRAASGDFCRKVMRDRALTTNTIIETDAETGATTTKSKTINFNWTLVDPPRAGLADEKDQTCKLLTGFEDVLYISCMPDNLRRDLDTMNRCLAEQRFRESEK